MSERAWAKAAVLDASYLPHGRLNIGKVQHLAAQLAARGALLWIPHVVLLEFAVHAWEDLTSNRQTHKRLRRAGFDLGKEPSDLNSSQIADELLKTCAAISNVVIIEMAGESAIAGLRDQILGTGAGTVNNGVRTDAADSSWVRDALGHASNDPHAVIFLSSNGKDVKAAAGALGHDDNEVQVWSQTGAVAEEEMLTKFFGPAPAPSPATDLIDEITVLSVIIASLRRDYAEAQDVDDQHGPPPEWIEVTDVSIGTNHDASEEADMETMIDPEAEIEPYAQLVDITVTDVYASNDEGPEITVDYIVRLLADVRVEGQKIDNDGDGYWDWVILRDRLLRVPYTAQIRHGVLANVVQTDTAENYSATTQFADNFDAYEWLYTAELMTWQHITVHPLSGDPDLPKSFELRGPHGRSETAELASPADLTGDWTLTLETTGASISAIYDHTARAALGRYDSFDVFPPVSLHSETRGTSRSWPQPYTALAELWGYLVGDGKLS